MASLNKVTLIGRLGAEPKVSQTTGGDCACVLSLATSEKWKDQRTGDVIERTEWHRVVLFKRLAEIARDYLNKGALIYVEGKLRTRKWNDNGVDKYTTEILVDSLKMLSSKAENQAQATTKTEQKAETSNNEFDDEMPF